MPNPDFTVRVEGLQDLRKSLRATDRDALKDVQKATKGAAEVVAARARTLAPRRTGALAASIRASTSGHRGLVRSRLPYANLLHWGGSTGRGHGPRTPGATRVKGTFFISRALEERQDKVVDALGDAIEKAARKHGWR